MITVYTQDNCSYCDMAKQWLNNHDFKFETINLSHDDVAKDFMKNQGHTTVPQIYWTDSILPPALLVEGGAQSLISMGKDKFQEITDKLTQQNLAFQELQL